MKQNEKKAPEEPEKTVEIFDLEGNITGMSILTKECDIEKFLKSCCFGVFYKITRNGEVLGSGRIGGGKKEEEEGGVRKEEVGSGEE